MEKITLHNGKVVECAIIKHEDEDTYICRDKADALGVLEVLRDLGNRCTLISDYSVVCRK